MVIVKLGGSLLGSAELPRWLDAISQTSDGRIVIVPGGGVFADAVRQAQQTAGFDDAAAHQLAVLAMDQYARVLLALNSTLVAASTELEIAERSWQHRAIVWLPSVMVLAEEKIPKTWDVTSDSLAAWLAKRIKAKHLVLVKATEDSSEPNGLLDVAFDDFAANLQCPVTVLGKNEIERFSAIVKPDMERVE
ncbi:MAG TPA: uridylate kinase [Methylophilaceae bacterium]|jgi:aspartokinase-like uncharacterized kinase